MSTGRDVPRVSTLRRLMQPPPPRAHACDMCAVELSDPHQHVVDIHSRRLLCACAACGANVGQPAAGTPVRYRAVPRRYAHQPWMRLSSDEWQALGIPVGLAFLFFNSAQGRMAAFYPGPAGATECLLPLDAWAALADRKPWLGALAPDVEACLVRRAGDGDDQACFIVPIDACYALVGLIRTHWSGLGGGETLRAEVDRFFAEVIERSAAEGDGA
jgi:hypothetical protein